MAKDTGADPRGGFKVVGSGEIPPEAASLQPAAEASAPKGEPRALRPKIIVLGLGGAGGNAVHNMIESQLEGVDLFVANTDAQALETSICKHRLQLGRQLTGGLGAGGRPEVGRAAAEESLEEILSAIAGASLVFIAAGMGGGTGTGAAPIVAEAIRKKGVLTVAVVTKPFRFEGELRMEVAEEGIEDLERHVDTLIVIPNQNLFKIATEKTSVADAFHRADNVLCAGVRGVTDLMVKPGLINLDFADFRSVMTQTGKAIMGAGEADGPRRAIEAAEAAMANPLLEDSSVDGARGVLINVTGGRDLTLFELDEAVESVRAAAHTKANIIVGSAFDEDLEGKIRVSVLATGILPKQVKAPKSSEPKAEGSGQSGQAATPPPPTAAAAAPEGQKAPEATAEAAETALQGATAKAQTAATKPKAPTEAAGPEQAAAPTSPPIKVEAATAATMPAAEAPAQPKVRETTPTAAETVSPKPGDATAAAPAPTKPAEAKAPAAPAAAEPPAKPDATAPAVVSEPPVTEPPVTEPPVTARPLIARPAIEAPERIEATEKTAAEAPSGGGRLTLQDILRRAERAMETKKAAEAAAAPVLRARQPEAQPELQPEPASQPEPKLEPMPEPQVAAKPPAPKIQTAPAEPALGDDTDLDALIDEVLIRNRKTTDLEPSEPTLKMPPVAEPAAPEPGSSSTDALLEDLAFSLASDDPFVLDEPAPKPAAGGKDLNALLGSQGKAPGGPYEQPPAAAAAPAATNPKDSEDAFRAELDRRARERARAALEALSESHGSERPAKPKPEDEDPEGALREVMNIPSFLRRTED